MARQHEYTEKECIDAIRRCAEITDGDVRITTYRNTMKSPPYPSSFTIENYLGSWTNAIRLAGLHPKLYRTVDEVLGEFEHTIRKLGYIPTSYEYEKMSCIPTRGTLKSALVSWSWKHALSLVGFDIPDRMQGRLYICPDCGTLFKKRSNRQLYCSPQCTARTKQSKYRIQRKKSGMCPQCRKPWVEPRETHRGKPKHCRRCQEYYAARYQERTDTNGQNPIYC